MLFQTVNDALPEARSSRLLSLYKNIVRPLPFLGYNSGLVQGPNSDSKLVAVDQNLLTNSFHESQEQYQFNPIRTSKVTRVNSHSNSLLSDAEFRLD